MKTGLKFKKVYWDDHLTEIYIEVTAKNIWTNITYYSDIKLSSFNELSILIKNFIENLKPFEWGDGDDNFNIKVYPLDKLGHIQIDFSLKNAETGYLDGHRYCECSLMFELGKIEKLGKHILNFIDNNDYSIEIEAMD